MSDPNDSTSDGVSRSSAFLEFCDKVRNNDPYILPEGWPLRIRNTVCEEEDIQLAAALQENANVTYLELHTAKYTKSSAEAMAKYVRTSKRLQRIEWNLSWMSDTLALERYEEMMCCFLPAFQESTSLKELRIDLPHGGASSLAFENMLAHTQSLRSLSLTCSGDLLEDGAAVSAARSGLEKNTTLRNFSLLFWQTSPTISPIARSLCDHPHLRRICLTGETLDLTGLDTLLLSDTSKFTELHISTMRPLMTIVGGPPMTGLNRFLKALARRPSLTKLRLCNFPLYCNEARLLQKALFNIPSLQSLALTGGTLDNARLAEIAPALYHNTSIKELNISDNNLIDLESATLLRDILRRNKTITTLNLFENKFGRTTGAVECVGDGLGSNSTLLKIDLRGCALRDDGVSTLAQTLGSRNTRLQKLELAHNAITSTGVDALIEMMEQSSHHITDLNLDSTRIGNEGASRLARSLGNNALPTLARLYLSNCGIDHSGFVALVSALEQNTSLLHLGLRNVGFSEQTFLALATSLPEIKVLQQLDFIWCEGLAAAMPLLLTGLRKNTSLFRFNPNCTPSSVPPTTEQTLRCAGSWIQEMERLGYRNRFLPLIRAPKDRLPPLGFWPHALARVATLPHVIFEVLRSKPNLVPFEDTEGEEAAKDTGKRKRGDE
jgi:Leucine-rich repeat (LRR) protein